MAHMNQSVIDYTPKTYAGCAGKVCKIDCSLGVNMEPLPERVAERLKNISEDSLKHYPHKDEVFDILSAKLRTQNPTLTRENLSLGAGSIDVLINLNTLFLDNRKTLLGYAPQFSAYVDDVHFRGARYIGVPLKKDENYKINVDELCLSIKQNKPDVVYVDNPNNPTGQILSKRRLFEIHAAADAVDAALIVDEAYGEYMTEADSMVSEVNKLNGLIVVKTLSKGYGMAGMRFGYALAAPEIIAQLNKLAIPFSCNGFARELAVSMLCDGDYLQDLLQATERKSKKLRETLSGKIKIANTADSTCISLLYTDDESIDLAKTLADVGILSVSGASFDNLSVNSVRLMVPAEKDMDLLCTLLREADRNI